jgi:AbrB family looped-hinge helix DNA binding protein
MTTLQIRGKGTITLPARLRKKYDLEEGDVLTLIDLGDGKFMLMPNESKVGIIGDRIARQLKEENVTLEDLLATLDEERERYYEEHYAKK